MQTMGSEIRSIPRERSDLRRGHGQGGSPLAAGSPAVRWVCAEGRIIGGLEDDSLYPTRCRRRHLDRGAGGGGLPGCQIESAEFVSRMVFGGWTLRRVSWKKPHNNQNTLLKKTVVGKHYLNSGTVGAIDMPESLNPGAAPHVHPQHRPGTPTIPYPRKKRGAPSNCLQPDEDCDGRWGAG